jgi:hypothetical protein
MELRHRARLARRHRDAMTTSGASAVLPELRRQALVGCLAGCLAVVAAAGQTASAAEAAPASEVTSSSRDPPPSLHAEVGTEYDTNVHRVEQVRGMATPPPVASGVGRLVLGLSSAGRLGQTQEVAFSVLGGVKGFLSPSARNENVLVVETAGTWRSALTERTPVSVGALYYDAIQAGTAAERALSGEARDFRSLSPVLRLGRLLGPGAQVELAGGYRWFVYKPDHAFDFQAPVLGLEYRLQREAEDGETDWELTAGAGVELRTFSGARLVPLSTGCPPAICAPGLDPLGVTHRDAFSGGHVELTRTGWLLVGLGYTLQWNRSNSYTESVFRHIGLVRAATALPGQLFLATRAELVYASYPDHVVLAAGPTGSAMTSIEDENRSLLRVELSRACTPSLRLVARYTLAIDAFGQSVVEYRRQTVTLSLTFSGRD